MSEPGLFSGTTSVVWVCVSGIPTLRYAATPTNNDPNLHILNPPIAPLRQPFHLQPSKHEGLPRTAGTEFYIFEDKSPPGDLKNIIIVVYDRVIARGEEALGLAWRKCYERG